MRFRSRLCGICALFIAGGALAELPPDAAVNPAAVLQTLQPKVLLNSGRLEWLPFHLQACR